MVVVEINGKKYSMPGSFAELSTEMYCRIFKEWEMDKPEDQRNYLKLFCILTNTDFKTFIDNDYNEVTIWNAVKWVVNEPFTPHDIPKALQIDDRLVSIPKEIAMQSIGQNILVKQEVVKNKLAEASISFAVAVYLQPIYYNSKFNFERAIELKAIIDKMPVYRVAAIGFFLLANALSYGKHSQRQQSQTLISRMRKKWRWLLNLPMFKGLKSLTTFPSLADMRSDSAKTPIRFSMSP